MFYIADYNGRVLAECKTQEDAEIHLHLCYSEEEIDEYELEVISDDKEVDDE